MSRETVREYLAREGRIQLCPSRPARGASFQEQQIKSHIRLGRARTRSFRMLRSRG
jgi:hypothetical protein